MSAIIETWIKCARTLQIAYPETRVGYKKQQQKTLKKKKKGVYRIYEITLFT